MLPRFLAATDSAAWCFYFAAATDGGRIGGKGLVSKSKTTSPNNDASLASAKSCFAGDALLLIW